MSSGNCSIDLPPCSRRPLRRRHVLANYRRNHPSVRMAAPRFFGKNHVARWQACVAFLVAALPACGLAQSEPQAAQSEPQAWGARFQGTYIWQEKPVFEVAYSGPHSLSPEREKSYSFTATAALGARPWSGGERQPGGGPRRSGGASDR